MFDSTQELLDGIGLGEDPHLKLKAVEVRQGGEEIARPERDDLADELAAFANSHGGVCVLGVDDESREIFGIPKDGLDLVEEYVREILHDSISPQLDAIVTKVSLPDTVGEAKLVIRIDVPKSLFVHQSPGRGRFYQRIGSSKRPIPPDILERKFQQRSRSRLIRFDEQAVPGITFEDLERPLWERFVGDDVEPAEVTLRKLRVLTGDGERGKGVSVAGVLMCSASPGRWLYGARIEAVRYRGDQRDANYQVDAESITGPAEEQIRRAFAFVDRTMRYAAIKDPERRELPQFSHRAVFEAIVNAVAHRDYSIHGSKIRLFVFDDRLELFSPGGLPHSLTVDSLHLRQSTRNELLATLLGRVPVQLSGKHQVGRSYFIEKRGEGVPIILRESRELSGRDPDYRVIDDAELLLTIWSAPPPE